MKIVSPLILSILCFLLFSPVSLAQNSGSDNDGAQDGWQRNGIDLDNVAFSDYPPQRAEQELVVSRMRSGEFIELARIVDPKLGNDVGIYCKQYPMGREYQDCYDAAKFIMFQKRATVERAYQANVDGWRENLSDAALGAYANCTRTSPGRALDFSLPERCHHQVNALHPIQAAPVINSPPPPVAISEPPYPSAPTASGSNDISQPRAASEVERRSVPSPIVKVENPPSPQSNGPTKPQPASPGFFSRLLTSIFNIVFIAVTIMTLASWVWIVIAGRTNKVLVYNNSTDFFKTVGFCFGVCIGVLIFTSSPFDYAVLNFLWNWVFGVAVLGVFFWFLWTVVLLTVKENAHLSVPVGMLLGIFKITLTALTVFIIFAQIFKALDRNTNNKDTIIALLTGIIAVELARGMINGESFSQAQNDWGDATPDVA